MDFTTDQQHRFYSGIPQPQPIPRANDNVEYSSGRPVTSLQTYGSAAMEHTYSNRSTNSTVSHHSLSSSATVSTPTSTYGSYDRQHLLPSNDYNHNPMVAGCSQGEFNDGLQQMNLSGNPVHSQDSGRAAKQTPRGLGWTPDTRLPELYKFVVPKGKPPYLELLPDCFVHADTPKIVHLDEPENIKGSYPCMFPGICLGKKGEPSSFSRPADLDRHYTHVHSDSEKLYPCDKRNCDRAKDPFNRKDHYRDHLRDYHKEDLMYAKRCTTKGKKVKGENEKAKGPEEQKQWLAERRISASYWRCTKCLKRIKIAEEGWECQLCHQICEEDRRIARQRLTAEESTPSVEIATAYSNCNNCNGTAWIESMNSGWDPCSSCHPSAGKYDYTWGYGCDIEMK